MPVDKKLVAYWIQYCDQMMTMCQGLTLINSKNEDAVALTEIINAEK